MDTAGNPVKEVQEAGSVYLLMKKDYRISRNTRAAWFFNNLNNVITVDPGKDVFDFSDELGVLSITARDQRQRASQAFRITTNTVVTFIAQAYRLVFLLDLSPSAAAVPNLQTECTDSLSDKVLCHEVYEALKNAVLGLISSLHIPGSEIEFSPKLYVSVLACTPLIYCKAKQVLIEGQLVTKDNVSSFLEQVGQKIKQFENDTASAFQAMVANDKDSSGERPVFSLDNNHSNTSSTSSNAMSSDNGFVNMLRQGVLALQLLPEDTSSGLAVITDGQLAISDAFACESLLSQLRNGTIACTFLQISKGYQKNICFGQIPNLELMQFIATATFGGYIASIPEKCSGPLNVYHKAFLLWSFHKGLECYKIANLRELETQLTDDLRKSLFPLTESQIWSSPLMRKKHLHNTLQATLANVLSLRLREGYTIKNVTLKDGQIEVKLVLPWRDNVRIEYMVRSSWPVTKDKRVCFIEVTIEGSYEFLHDITCTNKRQMRSVYRKAVVQKFWHTLQVLTQTDRLMVHLQSFSLNPVYYTIPESIKSGVPVFYMAMNSPALSMQLSSKDTTISQFAHFWKPVLMLDINIWQKWMHSHRIGIVLEHDMPLPKYLHIPNSSGRYGVIQCRQALSSLTVLLKDTSSFVLMENHSYVKLLYEKEAEKSSENKPPISFYLLRVTSKPPCMVLRIAFLAGTPGYVRHEEIQSLKKKIAALHFPHRALVKPEVRPKLNRQKSINKADLLVFPRKPPLQRRWDEIHCCILMKKPVEKILIRYEKMPTDFSSLQPHVSEWTSHNVPQGGGSGIKTFDALSKYLPHQRWVWCLPSGLTMNAIGRILTTLAKIRLQEGFHYIHTNSGIVNMGVEMDMMAQHGDDLTSNSSCVVQYVMFPPHITTTKESMSEDDVEIDESTESDGDLQLITECWVEPQDGLVVNSPPEREHFEHLSFHDLHEQIFPVDLECISNLATLEYLCQLCLHQPSHYARITPTNSLRSEPYAHSDRCDPSVAIVPYSVNVIKLLPKCQQVEVLFSTFIQSNDKVDGEESHGTQSNEVLFRLLFETFKDLHDQEIGLSQSDSEGFLSQLTHRERDVTEHPLPFKHAKSQEEERGQEGLNETLMSNINVREWRCYAKVVQQSNLVLTFLPASFHDLKKLDVDEELVSKLVDADDSLKQRTENNALETQKFQQSLRDVLNEYLTDPKEEELHNAPPGGDLLNSQTEAVHKKADDMFALPIHCDTGAYKDGAYGNISDNNNHVRNGDSQSEDCGCQRPITLPIYVYMCSMTDITDQLVNKWTCDKPLDLYQDMQFTCDSSIPADSPKSPRMRLSISEDARERMRISFDRRSTETFFGAEDLKNHCALVYDAYFKCFVIGVFESLSTNQYVHCSDVESAISNICEESRPLQINITPFLKMVCSHLGDHIRKFKDISLANSAVPLLDCAGKEIVSTDTLLPTGKPSVRFDDDGNDIVVNQTTSFNILSESVESERDGNDVPSSVVTMEFTLDILDTADQCQVTMDLHHAIKKKFSDLLLKGFQAVPGNDDYYFYCPLEAKSRNILKEDQAKESTGREDEATENESDIFQSDFDEETIGRDKEIIEEKRADGISLVSNYGTDTLSSDLARELELDEDLEENDSLPPLFLHLTCSVKTKTSYDVMPVGSLPTCLGELRECLLDIGPTINLNELLVTLDIVCLTLPGDMELAYQDNKLPSLGRYDSVDSSTVDGAVDRDDVTSTIVSTDVGLSKKAVVDNLATLPSYQQRAVHSCKEQIEWLLRDEITTSARDLSPLNTHTLCTVCKHIQDSKNKHSCSFEEVKLQFVYGPDKSIGLFKDYFEKIALNGYYLKREEEYYYLVLGPTLVNPVSHAHLLTTALVKLSRETSPEKTVVPEDSVFHESSVMKNSPTIEQNRGSANNHEADGKLSCDGKISKSTSGSSIQILEEGDGKHEEHDTHKLQETMVTPDRTKQTGSSSTPDSAQSNKAGRCDFVHKPNYNTPKRSKSNENIIEARNELMKKSASTPSMQEFCGLTEKTKFRQKTNLGHSRRHSGGAIDLNRSRHSSGTPSRSRHSSGKMSHICENRRLSTFSSSRSSCTEGGYEGDSSDSEIEEDVESLNELSKPQQMPNFWLIMKILTDKVEVYYHTRDSGDYMETEEFISQKSLYKYVVKSIMDTMMKVNQLLLLEDLYSTRLCNSLLVPENDEDVIWKKDVFPGGSKRHDVSSSEDEGDRGKTSDYLAATMDFEPGHYACDCRWKTHFHLHHRLKSVSGRIGTSGGPGIQSMKSVLNKFAVTNRKNMFVFKETNGNVFYLRLAETTQVASGHPSGEDDTASVTYGSLSPSTWSLHNTEDSTKRMTKDVDNVSITSSTKISLTSRTEESIELTVYGISEPGPEIQQELKRSLQRKLDDSVLEVISLMLMRNPMSKLSCDDVHFIQDQDSRPREIVKLMIPSTAVTHGLQALDYYLKQNLHTFLFTPKYADSKDENHFVDNRHGYPCILPEREMFLYRPPKLKGLGIIHVSIVDSQNRPVQLMATSKPSSNSSRDPIDSCLFDSYTIVMRYVDVKLERARPGPTALVQFTLWERGSIDVDNLVQKLTMAMRHALCDIVTEYQLMTTPVCEVPQHYSKMRIDSSFSSAPSSPVVNTEKEVKFSLPSERDGREVHRQSSSPTQGSSLSIYDMLMKARASLTSPTSKEPPRMESAGGTVQDRESQRRQVDIRTKIERYENGERGCLHPLYHDTVHHWLDYCIKLEVPSVQKFSNSVLSLFSVEVVLKELQSVIHNLSPDTRVPVFKLVEEASPSKPCYIPYSLLRPPIQSQHVKVETSLDGHSWSQTPGKPCHIIMIGRDLKQWRDSLDFPDISQIEFDAQGQTMRQRSVKLNQKFQPMDGNEPTQLELSQSSASLVGSIAGSLNGEGGGYVPRQRFLIMAVVNRELCLYTYNWASDHVTSLEKSLSVLTQWHCTRSSLLTCIFSQKMGLFHHTVSSGNYGNYDSMFETVIKHLIPPVIRKEALGRTASAPSLQQSGRSVKIGLHPAIRFGESMRDSRPLQPMSLSSYRHFRDPVLRHGIQLLEVRNSEKIEQLGKIQNLYLTWQQRIQHSAIPITEDDLKLLKSKCRLIHNVVTPLLFSLLWRHKFLRRCTQSKNDSFQNTPELKSRSRHSSGSSQKSKRAESLEGKKILVSGGNTPSGSPEVSRHTAPEYEEEAWHVNLRNSFVSQYIDYLLKLGFHQISTESRTSKRHPRSRHQPEREEKTKKNHGPAVKSSDVYSLQKTSPGGIIVAELSFRDVFFSVKLYAFDCMRIPLVGHNVNKQLFNFFIEECDKMKDLTHAHSFAHDFHLRCIQSYITGPYDKDVVPRMGFHLVGFLADFLEYYPWPPSFARNNVFEGTVSLSDIGSSSNDLFKYILDHDKIYGMKAVKMTPIPLDRMSTRDYHNLKENEFALTYYKERGGIPKDDRLKATGSAVEDFGIGLVITQDLSSSDPNTLSIRYYIVLTSKREVFPKTELEKKLGTIGSSPPRRVKSDTALSIHGSSLKPTLEDKPSLTTDLHTTTGTLPVATKSEQTLPVSQHLGVRLELGKSRARAHQAARARQPSVNYLGYSIAHQAPAYKILLEEANTARVYIENMVDSAKTQCRRDILWQRLLLMSNDSSEEERRRKRSDTEDSKDGILTRLSFEEFEELLSVVQKVALSQADPRLNDFLNMPISWYNGLIKVLAYRYIETERYFTNENGTVQYMALTNPHYLDAFLLLTIDSYNDRAELSEVYKDRVPEGKHTPIQPNQPVLDVQGHIESLVNTMCFHMLHSIL